MIRSLDRPSRALCAAWCLSAATAGAEAGDAPSDTPRPGNTTQPEGTAEKPIPRVDLTIVGDTTSPDALGKQVLSWFSSGVTETHVLRLQSIDASSIFAPSRVAGVRVWIFIPKSNTARLLFAVQQEPNASPRFLVDDVALDGGLDEVGREHLGQVVYLSARALWAGNVESTKKEVEARLVTDWGQRPPAPSPRPSPGPEPGVRSALGAEYAMRFRGDEGISHGPGVLVGVVLPRRNLELAGYLRGGFSFPRSPENGGMTLDVMGGDLRIGLAGARRLSERIWITTELGPGLDFVGYSPSFDDDAVRASAGRLDVRPFAYAALGLRGNLGSVSVTLAGLVAVGLQRTHYDVSTASRATSEVLVPSRVQPGVSLGFLW